MKGQGLPIRSTDNAQNRAERCLPKTPSLLVILLAVAAILMGYDINLPFVRMGDDDALINSVLANGYIKFGFVRTKFAPMFIGASEVNFPEQPSYYFAHPPLFPMLLSLSYRLFGYHEWAARLVPILFTLGTLLVIYFLAKLLWSESAGIFAVAVASLFPMNVIFGRMVSPTVVPPFFSMLALLNYVLWDKSRGPRTKDQGPTTPALRPPSFVLRHLVFFFLSSLLGMLTDLPGYFLLPWVGLHQVIRHRKRGLKLAVAIWGFSLVVGLAYFSYVDWVQPGTVGDMLGGVFLRRVGGATGPSLVSYLLKIVWRLHIYYTPVALWLSLATVVLLLWRAVKGSWDYSDTILILLFFYGITYNIVFRSATWSHPHVLIYLMPFVAITAALSLNRLWQAGFNFRFRRTGIAHRLLPQQCALMAGVAFTLFPIVILQSGYDLQPHAIWGSLSSLVEPSEKVLVMNSAHLLNKRFLWYFDQPYIHVRDVESAVDVLHLREAWASATFTYGVVFLDSNPSEGQQALAAWAEENFDTGLVEYGLQGAILLVDLQEGLIERRSGVPLDEYVEQLNAGPEDEWWGDRFARGLRSCQRFIETAIGIRDPSWGKSGAEGWQ